MCRTELFTRGTDGSPGGLIGVEAHIVARSSGGPRYAPLNVAVRDGYDNLILLCANDHAVVDQQPERFPVHLLREMKQRHETWVASRLHAGRSPQQSAHTRTVIMGTGDDVWEIIEHSLAYECVGPKDLGDEQAEVVDDALQLFADLGEISDEVAAQGFRAIRDAKRSLSAALDGLAEVGFLVLGGERQGSWAAGQVTGKIAVLHVVRPDELEALREGRSAAEP